MFTPTLKLTRQIRKLVLGIGSKVCYSIREKSVTIASMGLRDGSRVIGGCRREHTGRVMKCYIFWSTWCYHATATACTTTCTTVIGTIPVGKYPWLVTSNAWKWYGNWSRGWRSRNKTRKLFWFVIVAVVDVVVVAVVLVAAMDFVCIIKVLK